MKKMAIIMLFMIFLTSCNFLPNTEGDEFLKAPILNQMQQSIYDELDRTLDTKNIAYQYPKYGEQRSPFVFKDMNNDGIEEVIVFYNYKSNANELFARVLTKDDSGDWKTFYDIATKGNSIEFIDFAPLFDKNQSSLIVGWVKGPDKYLGVYSMEKTQMTENLYKPYVNYIKDDIDLDGISEFFVIQNDGSRFFLVYYGISGSTMKEIDSLKLHKETSKIEQVLKGDILGYGKALYIDEEMGGASISYGTEIISIKKDKLKVIVGNTDQETGTTDNVEWKVFTETFRSGTEKLLSKDFGNDGTVEVPRVRDVTEYIITDYSDGEEIQNIKVPNLVEYMQFIGGNFVVKFTAVNNKNFGYMVYFPERWIGKVTIVEHPQRQEWAFYKIDPKDGSAKTELFRIRAFYSSDYIGDITKDDFLLASRGLHSYYGYVADISNEPLVISREEAEKIFTLN